jgi:hypothetical protein
LVTFLNRLSFRGQSPEIQIFPKFRFPTGRLAGRLGDSTTERREGLQHSSIFFSIIIILETIRSAEFYFLKKIWQNLIKLANFLTL